MTFQRQLDLYFGGRHVQVLHHDRAVTPGDAFLYLPAEKIVVAGDLLVNPISFALSCYPTGWLATLERIAALEAVVVVPGHGPPLHDKALLRAHLALFRALLREGSAARARGLDPDQAREAILPALALLKGPITGGEPALDRQFEIYLVDWFLHRVFEELAGPLTDEIARIPPK
jgi:glyoxylase-like metal-dependent hydrolase (beta-lactamase superfamily II)